MSADEVEVDSIEYVIQLVEPEHREVAQSTINRLLLEARIEELYTVTPPQLAKRFALTIEQLKGNYWMWLDSYLKDRIAELKQIKEQS